MTSSSSSVFSSAPFGPCQESLLDRLLSTTYVTIAQNVNNTTQIESVKVEQTGVSEYTVTVGTDGPDVVYVFGNPVVPNNNLVYFAAQPLEDPRFISFISLDDLHQVQFFNYGLIGAHIDPSIIEQAILTMDPITCQ